MKKVLFLFMLLSSMLASSFGFPFLFNDWIAATKDVNALPCTHPEFFDNIRKKVMEEHPSESTQTLVKLITKEILKDPVHQPLFAVTFFAIEDPKNLSNPDLIYYMEFVGSSEEYLELFFSFAYYTQCTYGKNYSMAYVPRIVAAPNKKLSSYYFSFKKAMKTFFGSKNDDFLSQNLFARSLKKMQTVSVSHPSCAEKPKVQAVFDEMERLNITDIVQWTELCTEKINASLNLLDIQVIQEDSSKEKAAFASLGNEKEEDFDYCSHKLDDPRCYTCEVNKDGAKSTVIYFERL